MTSSEWTNFKFLKKGQIHGIFKFLINHRHITLFVLRILMARTVRWEATMLKSAQLSPQESIMVFYESSVQ